MIFKYDRMLDPILNMSEEWATDVGISWGEVLFEWNLEIFGMQENNVI